MKRNVWIMTLLFIMGSFSMELVAQDNLNALVKKCETMSSVNLNVIRERNEKTKKLETSVITISFESNKALVSEFLDAFRKDMENARQVIENKSAKGEYSLFFQFENVSFSISYGGKEGFASISVIY